jgi:flagellar motor switch protein FliM
MANAWSVIAPIKTENAGSEMNPQFVTIVTPSEIVIKVEIHIEIEDFTGKLFFCIPYSLIEPVKEKLYSGIQSEKFEMDQRWIARLKEILLDSPVEVAVELGKAQSTCGDLMCFEVGSVLTLSCCTSDDLPILVEGTQKFRGVPGFSRGNQAIRITKVCA